MKRKASSFDGGAGNRERSPLDLYPTPPEPTIALMLFLRSIGQYPRYVWEPAMGLGHMVREINKFTRVTGTDIQTGNDFFTTPKPEGVDWIITNPPFMALEEFVRRSAALVDTFALVSKATYWHAANKGKLWKEHPPSYILIITWRLNALELLDEINEEEDRDKRSQSTMSHIWNVWLPGRERTEIVRLERPPVLESY